MGLELAPYAPSDFIRAVTEGLQTEGQGYPWMPLTDETAQEYLAFEMWRDQGTKRPRQAHALALKRHWEVRALAYDEYLEKQPQDVQAQAAQIAKGILGSSTMVLHCLQMELIKTARNIGSSSMPSLTLGEIVKALDTLAKTARLLSDQSTANVAVVGKWDGTRLSEEELQLLDQLSQKGLTDQIE